MKEIDVKISSDTIGKLHYDKSLNQYIFNYIQNKTPISLTMPYRVSSYISKYKLHPIFDMNMPEGYLFEILKQYISKEYGYVDDFLIFSYLCNNIQSRLEFKSWCEFDTYKVFDIEDILNNDTNDTFTKLVHTYLSKNAISGVQPKSFAILKDKESLQVKEYIIKTWANEYEQLALNEYFCLKAMSKAGINTVNIQLSKNNKFLLVEKFNYDKNTKTFLGFEEVLSLFGKNKDEKYSSSYEKIAKLIYSVSTNKLEDLKEFYSIIVMNYMLKNGDAHLKNFGILYTNDFKKIWLSPAYDVVNTVVYYQKDRPALTMFGKKLWFGKKELIRFGIEYCMLSQKQSNDIYKRCKNSISESILDIKEYIKTNKEFENIGNKMCDSWEICKDDKTYKELPSELIRHWN